VRATRAKVRLIESGTATLGVIDEVELHEGKKGSKFVHAVRYTYLTEEDGEPLLQVGELLGMVPYLPGELREGEVVVVVYDPDNPDRNEIDRFDARQEDRLQLLKKNAR
jgi:hypothetical protein